MIYYLFEEGDYVTYRLVEHTTTSTAELGKPTVDEFMYDENNNKDVNANLSKGGKGTLSQYKNGVYFLNEINLPSTGIKVDILPYAVVVLAVIAAFAVLLISKKKRNAR
jgi:LPXTG-motif cell wall-anchored protein